MSRLPRRPASHRGGRNASIAVTALLALAPISLEAHRAAATTPEESGPTIAVTELFVTGCETAASGYELTTTGMPELAGYLVRVRATVGATTYADEAVDMVGTGAEKTYYFSIYDLFTYPGSPTTGRGTWPLPSGKPITIDLTVEDGFGVLLDGWTTVLDRCDGGVIVFNGPQRGLALAAQQHPRRVAGDLTSYGAVPTYAGLRVQVWQARPGPDRRVTVTRTDRAGRFVVRLPHRGRYYATTGALPAPAGTLAGERSATVTVR